MKKPLLYIRRENAEAGPYDLVQMAGLLRRKIITSETQTRQEGEEAWMPLSWQPQFSVIREMPADAVSMRMEELDEAALDRRSPIPLPSREFLGQLFAVAGGCLLLGLGAFMLAIVNTVLGTVLQCLGVGIAFAASIMIVMRMLNEDWLKVIMIFFIPLYDLYYLICNFEKYAMLLAVRYAAISVALGATWGLAMHAG